MDDRSAQVPGTAAHDLDRRIDTLKAMIGFNALNEMRANSPTGGALGNVTERELALLQSTVASLELSQSREQFLENLALVEEQFNRVIHGPEGAAPGEDPNLEPAPNVALPPPERVEPISAPAPASMSALGPEVPGPAVTPPLPQVGAPQVEAPEVDQELSPDEQARVAQYSQLPPDALRRQVEKMAANPDQYSDAEKRAAALAWERAFGGG